MMQHSSDTAETVARDIYPRLSFELGVKNAHRLSYQHELRSGRKIEQMHSEEIKIKLFDMVLCFSRALDLLHPAIADHHLRVAYIACCLAEEMGCTLAEIQNVLIAGTLHDAGAVSSTSGHAYWTMRWVAIGWMMPKSLKIFTCMVSRALC